MEGELPVRLRTYFDEWRTKEAPYPRNGGTVPDSPRDALVKVLAVEFSGDNEFLIGLAKDDRSGVRSAAREPIMNAAARSAELREHLLRATEFDGLEASLLRAAIGAGLYTREEATAILRLLHNDSARVRFAGLPILDALYVPVEMVRAECERLSLDVDLDIREAASRALAKVNGAAASN